MRLDSDRGDLIIEIRFTIDRSREPATGRAVEVGDQLSLILGSEDDQPRVGSPALRQRGVFDREQKGRVNGLGELVPSGEISSCKYVEPVGLVGVVCSRGKSGYLREGRADHFVCLLVVGVHGENSSTCPLRLVKDGQAEGAKLAPRADTSPGGGTSHGSG